MYTWRMYVMLYNVCMQSKVIELKIVPYFYEIREMRNEFNKNDVFLRMKASHSTLRYTQLVNGKMNKNVGC